MKPRKVSARISATPEEHKALFSLLEKERDRLIEAGESETPLGRAVWGACDAVSQALAEKRNRAQGKLDLAILNAQKKSP